MNSLMNSYKNWWAGVGGVGLKTPTGLKETLAGDKR
jgi:hypothetical protein